MAEGDGTGAGEGEAPQLVCWGKGGKKEGEELKCHPK
jgi:hypothetical protein